MESRVDVARVLATYELDTATVSARDRFVVAGLDPVGSTRAEIFERFGDPESVERQAIANRHVPEETDSILRLHYPGFSAVIVKTHAGRELLAQVTVRDDRRLRDPLVRIGMPWEEALARMGEPIRVDEAGAWFHCRACRGASPEVLLIRRGDVVEAIVFARYLD